jgi:sugar phosphate permease
MRHISPPQSLAWSVWGIGAALYFIAFYQRVAPAVLTQELSAAFNLTAAGLGHLSAFYFYSYVAMQVPTGLLADLFGPRRVLTAGAAVAAVGTAVFASAETTFMANMGRLFIGASVGVAFVAMLKLSSRWMPARQFALTSGVALAVGVFGAVFAGAPLRITADALGWRAVMWASALCTLLVAVLAWWLVRDDPTERGYLSYARADSNTDTAPVTPSVWRGLIEVLSYRNVVLIYFLAGAMTAIVLTFAGLWGVPFLTTHYGASPTHAALLASAMMLSWACGSLFFGWLSDRLRRRKLPLLMGMSVAAASWAVLILVPSHSEAILIALLVMCGFASGCFIVTFAFAKDSVPLRLAGTVSGVANMGVIQGPMFMQPLVGWMLDRSWAGTMVNGKRVFSFEAYSNGFLVILAWAVLAIVLVAFTRETFARQAID